MKKTTLILISLLTFIVQIKAQNILSVEQVSNKCLIGSLDYDKPFEWEEVDCSKLENSKKSIRTQEQIIKKEQDRIKLIKYQEKLITLGYNLEVNGILDEKTIKAHNKYIKRKNREEKRQRKKD